MAKKDKDMFGIGDDDGNPNASADAADADDEIPPFVILQITPADGWRAVFRDPTVNSNAATRTLGLACFALVEVIQDVQGPPLRATRPMVADELGEVNDVDFFDDFICLVPPGGDAREAMDYAMRAIEAEKANE
jgi:hypothetical protein